MERKLAKMEGAQEIKEITSEERRARILTRSRESEPARLCVRVPDAYAWYAKMANDTYA